MEQIKTRSKSSIYLSKRYKVIFHNDDKTTFEFVAYCLCNFFNKNLLDAIQLTKQVDEEGYCIAGTNYLKDIAETKKNQVLDLAKDEGFPFQVSVEED